MKIKLLFILGDLGAGGAERVVCFLAKNLDQNKFETEIIVTGFEKDTKYDTKNVTVSYLNKKRFKKSIFKLIKLLLNKKPNIVFSSIGHINIIMGLFSFFFRKTKFVVREASVISEISKFSNRNNENRILKGILKLLYRRISAVVCQSQDIKKDIITNYNIPNKKLFLINNPITKTNKKTTTVNHKKIADINFVTVGRLSDEKGHKRILEGLSKIKKYSFQYLIIGKGNLKKEIILKAKQLNIQKNIEFIDYTDKVLEYIAGSDYFIQGSYVEGFPNALLESCSVGTPVIAFKCLGGTREIIQNKTNGYLVENQNEFEKILSNLINSDIKFDKNTVINSVTSKFSSEIILNKYHTLFTSI